ncbi:MAG: hypothetical protein NZ578_08460 [Candidatus Binatia bacterium]|nr:hypothetical protein [Candidatus Binatia bacterium]
MDETFYRGQFEGKVIARLDALDATARDIKQMLEKINGRLREVESEQAAIRTEQETAQAQYAYWSKMWAAIVSAIISAAAVFFDRIFGRH